MTKRKSVPAKAPQKEINLVDSVDHDEIAKGMEQHVDGWAEMDKAVQNEIIALNIMAMSMHRPPIMRVDGAKIDMNDKNPQLHTMRLMRTFASSSPDFINYIIGRLATVLKGSDSLTAEALNAAFAFIDGLNPKTELEVILAVQMFATNDAAMRATRQMNSGAFVDTIHQFGNLSVKLMRTFTLQAEAMAKLQRGGVQTVKYIHVDNRGGQAVITEHVHQGGQNGKLESQSHEPSAALPCENTAGNIMPLSCYTGQEALPDTRRG